MARAILALEDGKTFYGESFGAEGETAGEVVFNTAMSGYQEIITDPSYKGQIILMTSPQIGNYGVNWEDVESQNPHLEGFIVRELSRISSNWRSQKGLDDYFREHGKIGIQGIDTRALTIHLRDFGAKRGFISTGNLDPEYAVKKAKESPVMVGRDLASVVTCGEPYVWQDDPGAYGRDKEPVSDIGKDFPIAVYDFGVKYNILRKFSDLGCPVTVYPAATDPDTILKQSPAGVFLSNGPGDPEPVSYAIENVRYLLGKIPVFGICLGHQILGLALGGKTYKLKFGHHGANHPVKFLEKGTVEITSQNHGFCVEPDSLKGTQAKISHWNLYDNTVEGLEDPSRFCFAVQYHPEASPGPHDSHYLFNRFIDLIKKFHA